MDKIPDFSVLDKLGSVAILVLLIFAFIKEWIVFGRAHRRELENLKEFHKRELTREREISDDYQQAWEIAIESSKTTNEQFSAIMAALDSDLKRRTPNRRG